MKKKNKTGNLMAKKGYSSKPISQNNSQQTEDQPGSDFDNKTYVKDYILKCKKEAGDATKEKRAKWKELWILYQSKQDYSKKKSWQSKAFSPKVFMQVEKASSLIKRALRQTSKLFKMEVDDSAFNLKDEGQKKAFEEQKARAVEAERKYKAKLSKSSFVNSFSEATKEAFLLGLGCVKALWDDGLDYECIDVFNLYISPDYKPFRDKRAPYLIEQKDMPLAKLRKLARDINESAGQEIFDIDLIDDIKEDFKNTQKDQEERTRKGLSQYSAVNKKVSILEFWGDIVSEDGLEIKENQLIWLVNEKYVIRMQDNPFKHKAAPYKLLIPIIHPHKGVMGFSLVEPMAKLQYTFNNVLNMLVDNLNFSVNKMFEVNHSGLMNPKSLTTIYPGKILQKNTSESVVKEVVIGGISMDAFRALDIIDQQMQAGTAVTEMVQGLKGKAKTLGEVEMKTAAAQGLFDVIARDLEEDSLKPLLEMGYELLLQFEDDSFTDGIKGDYIFKVDGVSLLVMQEKMVDRMTNILGHATKNEVLGRLTDIGDLWRKLLSIFNLSDVYRDEQQQPDNQQPDNQQLNPEQMEAKAAQDAKKMVSQLKPQDLLKLSSQMV